jgi:hypothetical protein
MTLRITGVLDFVHHPEILKENTTFRRLELFLSSGERRETFSVGTASYNNGYISC